MPKYRLYFTNSISSVVEVEADDLDDAIDEAYDRLPSSPCAYCAGMGLGNDPGFEIDGDWELDGEGTQVDDE